MVYDPTRGRVFLFGGDQQTSDHNDTWQYDGTWAPVSVANPPSPRRDNAMAWDPALGGVMFGGYGIGRLDDTWTF
jgi:hypothetical protein